MDLYDNYGYPWLSTKFLDFTLIIGKLLSYNAIMVKISKNILGIVWAIGIVNQQT